MFIVDFYCHEYKLVNEVDGEVHNNEGSNEYFSNKTAELNRFGLKVIRFTNDEVIYNINSIIPHPKGYRQIIPPLGGQGGKNSTEDRDPGVGIG